MEHLVRVYNERDRRTLLDVISSGESRFFLGTDSAPHARHTKEAACGCAGIFSAHAGIELYAEAFEDIGALARLEGFASDFGADFYGLPRNPETITLIKQEWDVPPHYPFGASDPGGPMGQPGGPMGQLVPFRAGERITWRVMNGRADERA